MELEGYKGQESFFFHVFHLDRNIKDVLTLFSFYFICTGSLPRAQESKVSHLESESPAFCSDAYQALMYAGLTKSGKTQPQSSVLIVWISPV